MSFHRDLSAPVSGQVSNQSVSMFHEVSQQNGNLVPSHMRIPIVNQNGQTTNEQIADARRSMLVILSRLMNKQQLPGESRRKLIDMVPVVHLERSLFESATSMEDYLDQKTLPGRLEVARKTLPQQFSHAGSLCMMIPTPKVQQTSDSSLNGTSLTGSPVLVNNDLNKIASSTMIFRSFSPAVSVDETRNVGMQRTTSYMIPTSGISNSNDQKVNSNTNNHVFMNVRSPSSIGASPAVSSNIISQPLQQRHYISGGNVTPNIVDDLDGVNSSQEKSYRLSNGLKTVGLGMMNGAETLRQSMGVAYSDSYQTLQELVMQGDGSESRNLYSPLTSAKSIANTDCLLINNHQPSMYEAEQTINVGEHFVRPHQQQSWQYSDEFHCQQLGQYPAQQNGLFHDQVLFKGNSQLSHDLVTEANSRLHDGSPSQVSYPFMLSGTKNQFQKNLPDGHSVATQILAQQSLSQDISSSLLPTSEHMQQSVHHQQLCANSHGDFGCLSGGSESSMVICGREYSISQNSPHASGTFTPAKNIQDASHEVQNNLYLEEPVTSPLDTSRSVEPQKMNGRLGRLFDANHERQLINFQQWLLLLHHSWRCPASQRSCQDRNCLTVQTLLKHMEHCNDFQCHYHLCSATRILIHHHRRCQDPNCPVCVPVKNRLQVQIRAFPHHDSNPGLSNSVVESCKSHDSAESDQITPSTHPVDESIEDLQPSPKRIKIAQGFHSLVYKNEHFVEFSNADAVNELQVQDSQHTEVKNDCNNPVKMEVSECSEKSNPNSISVIFKDHLVDACVKQPIADLITSKNLSGHETQKVVKIAKEMVLSKPENPLVSPANASKSKPMIKGVSMTEFFTPEQVRQHLMSLRQWIGQSTAKAKRNKAINNLMTENSCQLCGVERLPFKPLPIYCTPCGAHIKRKAVYYTIGTAITRHFFCVRCYNAVRGDTIVVDGKAFPKAKVEKGKNDLEAYEDWVQCDKCEIWQHQICALFNGKRNHGGEAEYTCPHCYIAEVERGERVPLPQSAVLGAKDLPRTNLSDHLEQRLSIKLQQEREERARLQGKNFNEVPGAEELVLRVVSSVGKRLDVKPHLLKIFREENYPNEFPYKSKVVLLFQKIEGVEVCLFAMYLQEYGSDCHQPNNRRVYLAYLDSVKYFRPDVKAVTGEALRTFVYHEILIGYLEHCKMRGFTSCYIWACPPLKGEDYILYCHPEIQKTPKSDKLREWYLSMLKKAAKEEIVVELTNMYDHFFINSGECNAKVTAARLPYFDGDYWPGAAEDIIHQLQQVEDGIIPVKTGLLKKSITKRALKASGQSDLSGNESRDLFLMQKLGETISPMKEDFIMVHLQHSCAHCRAIMVSGNRWVCTQCKNFQLCDKCYDAERKCEDIVRHPINKTDKHAFYPVEITAVLDDTNDNEILESEFFDTRHAFLNLCQVNHYQYDTLRHAKHSSMMLLYHLHNPTAPTFVTACSICHIDIEAGQGWRCEKCPEYEICNSCYQKEGGVDHPHKLLKLSSDHDEQNKEARQLRIIQLKNMLQALWHASQCRLRRCEYPNCLKVKELFRHGMACKQRACGGCPLCKKMWQMLQIHARACKESQCTVPRCRDLKVHLARQQQQSETRRRAAITAMTRQRSCT